jgi:mannose-6-phosphate isomerase-like protein (cupin superfamily)
VIEEFVGAVTPGTPSVSIARMRSPAGWVEPGQHPEFDEYTVVLGGLLVVEHDGGRFEVGPGQAVHTAPGEWVRYSSPSPEGAHYIAVCVPAFTPGTVHRDGV